MRTPWLYLALSATPRYRGGVAIVVYGKRMQMHSVSLCKVAFSVHWAPKFLPYTGSCPLGPAPCTIFWCMVWVLSCKVRLDGNGARGSMVTSIPTGLTPPVFG